MTTAENTMTREAPKNLNAICDFCECIETHPDEVTTIDTSEGEFVVCRECAENHDKVRMTMEARRIRRDELIAAGSVFADEGECGNDDLPCGICDECVSWGSME